MFTQNEEYLVGTKNCFQKMVSKFCDSGGTGIWTIRRNFSKMTRLIVIWLLLSLSNVHCRPNCSFDSLTESLNCHADILTAQNGTLLSGASHARSLTLECSEQSMESHMRANQFGYLPSLQSLSIESCQIRKVPSLAFSGLSGLKSLSIKAKSEKTSSMGMEINKEAFTGLNELRLLNLSDNNIWTLPSSPFCSLSSLSILNLSGNFLQDFLDLGFANTVITSCRLPLKSLDLSFNSFSRLISEAFSQIGAKLESVNLSNNNLNVIDDTALSGLTGLTKLNLANNQLVAIPPRLFGGDDQSRCCVYLQELHLQNNSLSGLAPGVFDGMKHLLVLNLSRNALSDDWLTPNIFHSLMRLVALDLSHNRLNALNNKLLKPLTSLQLLDLSHNQIRTLAPNLFAYQYNLHSLRLSFNNIEVLHPRSLSGLSVLGSLSLDNNQLSSISKDTMQNCTSLTDFQLQFNRFTEIPASALSSLAKLKTLDLGGNKISQLSAKSLSGLKSIYALGLASNGLEELSPEILEEVPGITVLNLANNQISKLDQGVFNALRSLRMLRLDNNNLDDINGILAGQTELKWLNVSSNKLQWFDYAFIPKGLEWLDISNNLIEDLGNYYNMEEGFNLGTLDASQNRIKKLEPLSLPKKIEVVNLSENKIRHVAPATFQMKTKLKSVDLTDNLIKQLQISALAIRSTNKQRNYRQKGNVLIIHIILWVLI